MEVSEEDARKADSERDYSPNWNIINKQIIFILSNNETNKQPRINKPSSQYRENYKPSHEWKHLHFERRFSFIIKEIISSVDKTF